MSTILETFTVGNETFEHVLFSISETVELQDESGETLIIYNGDWQARTINGKLGDFQLEDIDGSMVWVFYENPNRDRIVCTGDLIESELMISRRWIEHRQAFAKSLISIGFNDAFVVDSEGGHCD
jgi:hypothetical protein